MEVFKPLPTALHCLPPHPLPGPSFMVLRKGVRPSGGANGLAVIASGAPCGLTVPHPFPPKDHNDGNMGGGWDDCPTPSFIKCVQS